MKGGCVKCSACGFP